ncbi:MAG: energy transducer TonB [Treponema sp.]|nr:energy transducer TonB [Treponema sp.]
MNEKFVRLIIIIITAGIHLAVIFFLVFDTEKIYYETSEDAKVMRLLDLEEHPPPPPPEPEIPVVEEIAEIIIETDTEPVQTVVGAGTLTFNIDDFLPAHRVATTPVFDDDIIASEIIYPPIALRSGIEGRVILDLFVDRSGTVQRITILREEPEGRGFGEAAIRVFTGRKGKPAVTAAGEPVSCRYRYPVTFRIK